MKRFAILGLFLSSVAFAGECADCGGRQGLLSRRAERRAARSSCNTCESAEVVTESVQPAEIRTTTRQRVQTITGPAKKSTVIVPTGSAQTVAPSKGK